MVRKLPLKKDTDAPIAFFFLYLYTFSVLVRPHEFSVATAEYIFIQIFAILSFIFVIFSLRPIKIVPQHLMLLAMPPLIVMSGFLNGSGMDGIDQVMKVVVSSIIPFFLFSVCLTSIKRQHKLMYICIFAALVMVYNGHMQQSSFDGRYGYGIGGSLSMGGDEMRIAYLGFFGDPNDLGMFLVMNIPFVAYFYSEGKAGKKIIMLSIMCALFYGVFMTGSRGTLLGSIGVIAAYYFLNKAGAKLVLFCAIMAPLAATLLTSFGGLTSDDESANQRLEAWYAGILMLLDNPIFGVGMGNFMEEHVRVAHNSYIHVAAELGIPGYSLWGGVLVLSVFTGYVLMKQYNDWPDPKIATEVKQSYIAELKINKTLLFSMIGFMITAFFLSRSYTLLLFIFLGMQTASHGRLVKLRPELNLIFESKMVYSCILYSWAIIVTVYIALKVGL